jgi:hypothetical protein
MCHYGVTARRANKKVVREKGPKICRYLPVRNMLVVIFSAESWNESSP